MPASDVEPTFGVYVHWPFCLAKCPYCDFNSHVRHGGIDEPRFRAAYLTELGHMAARSGARTVTSIFFGGGTPSLMAPATVGAILDRIAGLWRVAPDVEVTLEANPTSVEASSFAGYRAAGVNRVSLGVQALDDRDLKALGRMHTAAEALAAVETAKRHFARVSFDLIYARPQQSPAAWRAELEGALAHAVGHLSLYQLTIEPGTPYAALYARGALRIPNAARASAHYRITQELTGAAGLAAYEVSNHAAPGQESRHNLVYWRGHDYAGVGPGAHGRLTVGGVRHALSCIRNPEAWRDAVEAHASGIEAEDALSGAETADEYLMMSLRLAEGLDLARYAALAGRPIPPSRVAALVGQGLLRAEEGRIAATAEGFVLLDTLVLELASGSDQLPVNGQRSTIRGGGRAVEQSS